MPCTLDGLRHLALLTGIGSQTLAGIDFPVGCHEATQFVDGLVVDPGAVLDTGLQIVASI